MNYKLITMNFLLDVLFPKKCVGCGEVGSYFCKVCVSNILQGELICPVCERSAIGGTTHPFCRTKFSLDGLWSLGLYQDPLRKAIQKLKYQPALVRDFASALVNIMLEYWAKYQPFILDQIKKDQGNGWIMIPVPLFWFRENERGFNQSKLLGQLLSKNLGLDYCDGLKRIRATKPQAKLKSTDRRQNIRGAFAISPNYTLDPKPYTLLIDDVWTTGSTLQECCRVLKKNGARKVWAITIAR